LILTEEQTMLRDSAREVLSQQAPVAALRKLRDGRDADGHAPALWRQFGELGFAGVLVPEDLGGAGLGQVEAGVVMEQIGRNLSASPFLASSVVAVTALRAGGSAAQQQAWLPRIAAAGAIATLAVDEGVKHRPAQTTLRAAASADGWVLDGSKCLVVDGHVADLLVVAARSAGAAGDADGLALFLVDPKAEGVAVERTVMVDAHNAARVDFRGVRIGADALLAGGAATLAAALDAGRVGAAAELLGLADEVFERTVAYLKQRRQFDRTIGEFQALQHRAAQLYCELEITRAAVLKAQQALDAGAAKAADAVAVAKARAGRTATLAVQEGVQMHGGMGMTDEFDLGLFMKRARVLQELFGDSNYHLDALAHSRGY
jgi:alkylation response protein AidB-like acyl-CoA dehydrogenase